MFYNKAAGSYDNTPGQNDKHKFVVMLTHNFIIQLFKLVLVTQWIKGQLMTLILNGFITIVLYMLKTVVIVAIFVICFL